MNSIRASTTQALQVLAIDRLAAMLEAMKTERVFKQVYYMPRAITQAAEAPFAYFGMAADRDYPRDETHGGPPRYNRVQSRLLLTVAIRRKAAYAVRELAELIDVVRRRLESDFPDPPGS